MADVSRFYEGILPAAPGPAPGPVVTDWNDFYTSVGIPASPDLTTRTVQTVPVNGSNWANPAGTYVAKPHMAQQLPPTNETYVPSSGVPFGNGPQAGYVPPGSYRLTPNPGLPSAARDSAAVAAIGKTAPSYIGQNHPALTLPQMASATPGGLPFATKYENALRTAALLRQVGLTDATGKPRPRATQEVTAQMKPRGLLDMLMGGKDGGWQKPGLLNLLMNGQTAMQMRPAPTRPESGYGSLGYTPSSSGQSNDYFTNARNGSVPDINYGISGSYSSGGARSLT